MIGEVSQTGYWQPSEVSGPAVTAAEVPDQLRRDSSVVVLNLSAFEFGVDRLWSPVVRLA
jgi:hypothetical protein